MSIKLIKLFTALLVLSALPACKLTDSFSINNLVTPLNGEGKSPAPPVIEPEPDLYFTSVVLLCNFDSSAEDFIGHVLLPSASAVITNSDYRFGTGSMAFDGIDASPILLPNSPDFFLDGDFTIELWFKTPFMNPNYVLLGSNYLGASINNQIQINQDGTDRIGMYDGSAWLSTTDTVILDQDRWYHVAFSRQADVLRIYLDGQKLGDDLTGSVNPFDFSEGSIGSLSGYGGQIFEGQMDELRITKGIARYTANSFPLQSTPFPLQ